MFCYKCGTQLPDGAAFCIKCGAKMQTEESETVKEDAPVTGEAVKNGNGDFQSYLNDYIFNLTRCRTAEEFLASDVQPKEKQSGLIYGELDTADLCDFLNKNLAYLQPYFHEWGILTFKGDKRYLPSMAVVTSANLAAESIGEIGICTPFGDKQDVLAVMHIRPDVLKRSPDGLEYFFSSYQRNMNADSPYVGIMGGLFGKANVKACKIKAAPILHAAIEFYSEQKKR